MEISTIQYLEPVALAVSESHVDDEDGEDKQDRVENAEVEVHGLVNNPPRERDDGDDKQRNLLSGRGHCHSMHIMSPFRCTIQLRETSK
jgi:hypothetical protein